jgi:chromosome segregation ATPase
LKQIEDLKRKYKNIEETFRKKDQELYEASVALDKSKNSLNKLKELHQLNQTKLNDIETEISHLKIMKRQQNTETSALKRKTRNFVV